MDFKLAFLVLATFAVVMVTAESEPSENQWRLQDFLQLRPREKADCIKKCQSDCRDSRYNCCLWPGMTQHAKCRTIAGTYANPRYQWRSSLASI
ncbi:hypothetical protein OS493_032483 [Desmophyllum pertusum]|uniref:Uncharacterized protein n=1 Tax=Desmophyllum pertusum TaxID=174260 RepID=A0A9W9ZJE7_9CNID|nr:hypothetical protein OS493_032483 [Desmophyllum pertusum]